MISIQQQLIKALRQIQGNAGADLLKSLQNATTSTATTTAGAVAAVNSPLPASIVTSSVLNLLPSEEGVVTSSIELKSPQQHRKQQQQQREITENEKQITSSQKHTPEHRPSTPSTSFSFSSHLDGSGCEAFAAQNTESSDNDDSTQDSKRPSSATATATATVAAKTFSHLQRSQKIQQFYQLQLNHFHTQHNQRSNVKQYQLQQQQQQRFQGTTPVGPQTNSQKNTMSSLAAEPLASTVLKQQDAGGNIQQTNGNDEGKSADCSSSSNNTTNSPSSSSPKSCFNTGLSEILQFMELIGNLKHTKRTGWVLRDVNDCESISGHMYRMSMMTFLLDGSEGLNQIRCMELALVHDLAESLVGDITPFCGISKKEKRAMEFKAMDDICKLIEPRGKRIMELFHEYELGESAESKFVKDLDRLDMVMQAFEYEKRDNCLLKHQEFFDSTEGKFKHPFIQKLVNEIYEQRNSLARAKGATPPPPVKVPCEDDEVDGSEASAATSTNGHCSTAMGSAAAASTSASS